MHERIMRYCPVIMLCFLCLSCNSIRLDQSIPESDILDIGSLSWMSSTNFCSMHNLMTSKTIVPIETRETDIQYSEARKLFPYAEEALLIDPSPPQDPFLRKACAGKHYALIDTCRACTSLRRKWLRTRWWKQNVFRNNDFTITRSGPDGLTETSHYSNGVLVNTVLSDDDSDKR